MDHGNYEHPLYSYEFVPVGMAARTDRTCFLTVPEGQLTIRPALLKRGQELTSDACDRAIGEALAYHGQNISAFARYGMGSGWAGSLRYWGDRVRQQEAQRTQLMSEGQLHTRERQALYAEARRAWTRLKLSAQLSGLGQSIVRGGAPLQTLALCEALDLAIEQARVHAEVLKVNGFGVQDVQRLEQVVAALLPARKQGLERQQTQRDWSSALWVMRGAIVGDLGRLCRVGPQVLPEQALSGLRMHQLFPVKKRLAASRQSQPSGTVRPGPA